MVKRVLIVSVAIFLLSSIFFAGQASSEGTNIVSNPGFEDIQGGTASGWNTEAYDKTPGAVEFLIEEGKGRSGTKCYTIKNSKPNVSGIIQEMAVNPGSIYKVSCWIKVKDIGNKAGAPSIWLYYGSLDKGVYTSDEIFDTGNDWKLLEFYIKTLENYDKLMIKLSLGGVGTTNKGVASFDDVSVELAGNADSTLNVKSFYVPSENTGNSGTNGSGTNNSGPKTTGINTNVLVIAVIIIIVGLIIYIELKLKKSGKPANNGEPGDNGGYDEDEDDWYEDEEDDGKVIKEKEAEVKGETEKEKEKEEN